MHSALLIIVMPNTDEPDGKRAWHSFLGDILHATDTTKGIEKPSENCWLIPLDSGASFLAVVVAAAAKRQLRHRILFFDKEPVWVEPPKEIT